MTNPIHKRLRASALGASALCVLAVTAQADQVFLDDLIVDGSACIGQDCVNGESFGFDTIRIKENNLRIKAQDTSSTASFPTQDWELTFNESSNGGQNKFSVTAISPIARTPFTIEDSARANAIYVDGSNVGFGTTTPVVTLHAQSGNTPTLRLQQDGSSGFAQQTWDVAGNEAGFFVRDATNGSQLPFRIIPGADSNALVIDDDNDISMGAGTNPTASLHVERSDGTTQVLVEDTGGSGPQQLVKLQNNGAVVGVLHHPLHGAVVFQLHQLLRTRAAGILDQQLRGAVAARHMQRGGGVGARTDADIIVPVDHQALAVGAGQDAEGQRAAGRGVADEEARLVARHVPGLRGEPGGAVLLQAHRGRIAGPDVDIGGGRRGAQPHIALTVDGQRVRPRAGKDAKDEAARGGVLDAKIAAAAIGAVIGINPPVVWRKGGRGRGVVEMDAQVVFLQPDRVETKGRVGRAIKADAQAAIDDEVLRLCRGGHQQKCAGGGCKPGTEAPGNW